MKIAFIGGGNMARSLIGGIVESGVNESNIMVADPIAAACESLSKDFGIVTATDNEHAIAQSDIIVLAVKPQLMRSVLSPLANQFNGKLLISIAAGVLSRDLARWAGSEGAAVVRCMPNTPSLLQCGATALYANSNVTADQKKQAQKVLSAVGDAAWVEQESQLDAITALSGSGPAYFFLLMESMADAAKEMGLSAELANRFAIQTALGAARMAGEGTDSAAQLRKKVTSPAGTTEAAINSFTNDNFSATVQRAMQAAEHRATELGKELGDNNG